MSIPVFQVDAFTSEPFAGNPAAVCLLPEPQPEQWMQAVAREMNLSETAFLVGDREAFRLRWFTPEVEVQLCGHATLASAHVLWSEGCVDHDRELSFTTASGVLGARRCGESIELDFPARVLEEATLPEGVQGALGVHPDFVGRSRDDYLVLVGDEATVRSLSPDFAALRRLDARGVIVTAPAVDDDFDFVSRLFAPAVGINEDPVTGSAHCCLGPFWGSRLGRSELRAFQASSRGGAVSVRVQGDRVHLGGEAVTVLRGQLEV